NSRFQLSPNQCYFEHQRSWSQQQFWSDAESGVRPYCRNPWDRIIPFLNAAPAGDGTVLTALGSATDGAFGGSVIYFYDACTAGNSSIVAEGARGREYCARA